MQRTELSNGIEQIVFDGFPTKPMFGYAFPGPGGRASKSNALVQSVITAVGQTADATYAARRDASLAPTTRVTKVQPQRQAAKELIARTKTLHLNQEGQRIANAREKLFAVPALDPGDIVGAHVDMEIRQRWPLLTDHQRNALTAQINNGDKAADRVHQALCRDAFPTPESQWAKAVYANRVAAERPADVASIEIDEASLEWAQSAIVGLENILTKTESSAIPPLSPETGAL